MKFYGRNVSVWRLASLFAALIALLVAAFLFLPGSFVRLALSGLIALPVAFYLLDRSEIVFYLFTFIIFSNVDVYSPIPIFQPFAIFMVVTLALAIVRSRKLALLDKRFVMLIVAFVLLSFQSFVVARDLGSAIHVFSEFMKIIICLLITSQYVHDRRQFRIFLIVMVAAIVANNLLPMIVSVPESYASPSLIGSQGVLRYQGLVFEPNGIAFLQIFFIPLYLFLAGVYRRPFIARWVFVGALIVSMVVIVLSFSRGSFIAFALLFLLFLYSERRNKAILLTGIVLIVIAVSLVPPAYMVRIESISNALSNPSIDHPLHTRLVTYGVASKLGAKNLVSGVGIGNFLYHAPRYMSYSFVAHNVPLMIFSELGVFALSVFIAIIVFNVKVLLRLAGRRHDREASLLGRMLLLQHAVVLTNAMFIPAMYDHALWYTLALPSFALFAYRSSPKGRK